MTWNQKTAKQLFLYFLYFFNLLTLFLFGLRILIDQIKDFSNGHIVCWKFLLIILGYGFLSGSISVAVIFLIWAKDLWQTNTVHKKLLSCGTKIYQAYSVLETLDSKLVEIIQRDLAQCDKCIKAYDSLSRRKYRDEYFLKKQYESIDVIATSFKILKTHILKAVKFFQTFETYEIQKLPFPEPMIDYLFKGANQKAWLKLCQTSKYFYGQHRMLIFDGLDLNFENPKANVDTALGRWNKLRSNIWLKNTFKVHGLDKDKVPNPSVATRILQRILYCNIIELFLTYQTITLNDYLKLTCSKTIKYCFLGKVNIVGINGLFIQLDEILKCLPNVEKFMYVSSSFTLEGSKPILQLPQLLNLKKCKLLNFNEALTPECFCHFVKDNPNCYSYAVTFNPEFCRREFIFKFRQDVSKLLDVLEDDGRKITITIDNNEDT